MKNLTFKIIALLMLSCLFVFASATIAFAQEPTDDPTLLEQIQSHPDLTTLATVVVQAGLSETLSDPNANLTIIAPSNDAFAAIDAADLQALLADQAQLEDVILYHVISGTFNLVAITTEDSVTTLQGGEIIIGELANGTSPLPGLNSEVAFLVPNIDAQNGIIHIVDGVLFPEATAVTLSGAQATISSTMVIFIAVLSLVAITPLATRR